MEGLFLVVGVIGNIISVLLFLSPIGTFYRIVKQRSTQEFESFPYICTLLSAALWTYYGVNKPGSILVATVNGFGFVVESIYVCLFLTFAPPRMRVRTAILASILDVAFLGAAIVVSEKCLHGYTRIYVIGFLGAALNIVMYGSPLSVMRTVVRTKSVEYMPFLLSFFMFLNGGVWTFYAILSSDYFLGVPNAAGFVLGLAQLVLYVIYKNRMLFKLRTDNVENGWQHEHLIKREG